MPGPRITHLDHFIKFVAPSFTSWFTFLADTDASDNQVRADFVTNLPRLREWANRSFVAITQLTREKLLSRGERVLSGCVSNQENQAFYWRNTFKRVLWPSITSTAPGNLRGKWPTCVFSFAFASLWIWLRDLVQKRSPLRTSWRRISPPFIKRDNYSGWHKHYRILTPLWHHPRQPNGKADLNAKLVLTSDTFPSFVPCILKEICLSQDYNEFCCTMCARLGEVEKNFFAFHIDDDMFCSVDGFEQREVHQVSVPLVLHLRHYAKKAENLGGRRSYKILCPRLFYTKISVDLYANVRSCLNYVQNMVNLWGNNNAMQLFPAPVSLKFLAIDIFGQLLATKRGNRFL